MYKHIFKVLFLAFFSILVFCASSLGDVHYTKSTELIKMSDDVKLATDVYLPKVGEKWPCILMRSPYNKNNSKGDGEKFTKLGYAVVIQDTRGKFESEGKFYPFAHDRNDGLETIDWIKAQKWFGGKIAGWGGSYVGYTQWAIADKLDAFVPVVTSANMYDLVYPSGIFSLATAFNWGLAVDSKTVNSIKPEKIVAAYSILPLSVADDSTFAQNDFMDDWLKHETDDEYWQRMNHRTLVPTPMYSIAGWYDIFLEAQIKDFVEQGEKRHPDSKLVVGPYAHGQILLETDYGEHGNLYRNEKHIHNFLANHLKSKKNEYKPEKPFSFFIIHKNEWIEAEQWPPKSTRMKKYYFTENGIISDSIPNADSIFEYSYDPKNPFISLGGTYLGVGVGPALQNPNVERKDQVVFESRELAESMTLLGPINASIWIATDAKNTDLFVSLQEVLPNGDIINIQEGGQKVVVNDKNPQKVNVSVWPAGYQINAGNKIRVMITSSLFPRYNRTLNSAEPIFAAQKSVIAHQKIYVGEKYPSSITLPVFIE